MGAEGRYEDWVYLQMIEHEWKRPVSDGYGQVWPHLATIQERRNRFAHGQPQSIDDALVQSTVEQIKVEHEAWIAVFNKRAARP
jgi:hypothetical protein